MKGINEMAAFGGVYHIECLRLRDPITGLLFRDARGRFMGRKLIWEEHIHNVVTNEGLDSILDVYLHASTQITAWYCVMSETNTAGAAGLTYAVPSFTETAAYDEGTRPAYNEAAASSQSITNSANKATFTISGTKTLYGAGLVGGGSAATTKSNTAGGGTLFSYAKFAASRAVVDNDVVNLTITIGSADA